MIGEDELLLGRGSRMDRMGKSQRPPLASCDPDSLATVTALLRMNPANTVNSRVLPLPVSSLDVSIKMTFPSGASVRVIQKTSAYLLIGSFYGFMTSPVLRHDQEG